MWPIEMIVWFTKDGIPHPIRYKLTDENKSNLVIKVDQVITRTEEKLAGNKMIVFRCQSIINGALKMFELKYELNTCKWFLYKAEGLL